MRTYFAPEEQDAFEVAGELFGRRCSGWALERGLVFDALVVRSALVFRHEGVDGRLGYWTGGLVREFLLEWMPRSVSVAAAELAQAPEALRTVIRYLDEVGLLDPLSDTVAELDVAIDTAAFGFEAAMSDERNFSLAKYWVMQAREHGVDVTDLDAMNRFSVDLQEGRIAHDREMVNYLMGQDFEAEMRPGRGLPQLPVVLLSEDELSSAAEHSEVVRQLRVVAEWVGADGRPLTAKGQLKVADARELAALLGESSAELPTLGLVELAKAVRLVRVVKGRLVTVAKARPLLRDALALWHRAFAELLELPDLVLPPSEHTGPSVLNYLFRDVVPDVLNTLHGMPDPIPLVRLEETVLLSCLEMMPYGGHDQHSLRPLLKSDLATLFQRLVDIGAVELTVGPAHPMFFADLGDSIGEEVEDPLPLDTRRRLRDLMAPEAGPLDLVRLTALGTAGVHARLRAQGRFAPLVGELVSANAVQLLGVLSEHYTPETASAELLIWLDGRESLKAGWRELIDAMRACPFRSRAAAMLDMLASAWSDGARLLHDLRSDEILGPIAVNILVSSGQLSLDEVAEAERLQGMTEQMLQLLEVAGPESMCDMVEQAPDAGLREALAHAVRSTHHDKAGIEELRTLVLEASPR